MSLIDYASFKFLSGSNSLRIVSLDMIAIASEEIWEKQTLYLLGDNRFSFVVVRKVDGYNELVRCSPLRMGPSSGNLSIETGTDLYREPASSLHIRA